MKDNVSFINVLKVRTKTSYHVIFLGQLLFLCFFASILIPCYISLVKQLKLIDGKRFKLNNEYPWFWRTLREV